LNVEQRRYRLRLLNGCNSRFLILDFSNIPGVEVWQIGTEGGFLPAPINITYDHGNRILLALAERADIIVDFTNVALGNHILTNLGPDEPFGGGAPGVDFDPADPATTGQVMQFRVGPASNPDTTTLPNALVLPAFTPLGTETYLRQLSLNELDSETLPETGPMEAQLGTLNPDGTGNPLMYMEPVTENPALGSTEIWEMHNFTADAHPIHIHQVQFQVVNRQVIGEEERRDPEAWEVGYKDTVISYPGEITRIRAQFDIAGRYVWHCHIVDHEDNEMMRPFEVI
jgi:FtsP/CotA-like multicopper oxidase with cupredoxin domain